MRRKTAVLTLVCLVLTLCACANNAADSDATEPTYFEGVPKDMQDFFLCYLDAAARDWDEADEYGISTHPPGVSSPLINNPRITNWEPLTDALWNVHYTYDAGNTELRDVDNFVAKIDGAYILFRNIYEIPEDLKGDLDLSCYDDGGMPASSIQTFKIN